MNTVTAGLREAVPFAKLPLLFARNIGQFNEESKLLAQASGFRCAFEAERFLLTFYTLGQEGDEALSSKGVVLAWTFLDACREVKLEGIGLEAGKAHYFKGNDPAHHRVNADLYRAAAYRGLWPGIDVVVQGAEGKLKFDWFVKPGAKAEDIKLLCEGADAVSIDEEGQLRFTTPFGELIDQKPIAYQEIDGKRTYVACRYQLENHSNGGVCIGFDIIDDYNREQPLIIDPVIEYSTYLGGSSTENGLAIAVDDFGQAYVTGSTISANFPVTPGAFQTALKGAEDFFVTKLDPTGTALVYSTYIGGSARDIGRSIAIDQAGHAYVTGSCFSNDYPTTPGAFQPAVASARAHAVITKLSPDGRSLVYSTYLGGTGGDGAFGIAVDFSGNAYVAGQTDSPDFPVTAGAIQTTNPTEVPIAFVTKLNAAGSGLVYSTYLGGSGGTTDATCIAIDNSGNAYVSGGTVSRNFPTTPGAFQTTLQGDIDSYVSKLNPTGTALVYSTILGSSLNDTANAIAVDDAGNAYVTGQTTSPDFPTTPGSFVTPLGIRRVYVTKFNPDGTGLIYSALIGGDASNTPFAMALTPFRQVVVTGQTTSTDYPVTPDAFQPFLNGAADAFVTMLDPFGSFLEYSTYLGGSSTDSGNGVAVDHSEAIYVTGQTFSFDYPTTPGAFQPSRNGIDAFVTKFGNKATLELIKFSDRFEVRPGEHVTFFIELRNESVALTNVVIDDPFLGFFTVLPVLHPFETHIIALGFFVPEQHPPGIIVNEVFVKADQLQELLIARADLLITESPVLSALKKVSPAAAAPGETVIFTITLNNLGNVDLFNVRIVDSLLGLDQVVEVLRTGTSFEIDWPFVIPEGQPVGLTIANVATITGDNLPTPERVGTVVEVLPAPRIELVKSADRISVFPGETIQFTLMVTNTGNTALTNVRIADDTIGEQFLIPSLAVGETETFTVPFHVPLETPPQTYTNTAVATSDQAPNASASFDVAVLAEPRIGVRKLPSVQSAMPGQTIQYTIVIDNIGNVPLTAVRLDDSLLGFSQTLPSLLVGERQEFVVPYVIPLSAQAGSEIINELTVQTAETGQQQVRATVTVTAVGLLLTKTADRATAAPGDTITYTLSVTSLLSEAQTNVVLNDPLLGLSETIALLPPGATITRSGTAVVPAGAANGSVIVNQFTVSSDQTPLQSATAAVVVIVTPGGETTLSVSKLPDRDVAAPGESVRYTVEITNTGGNPATNVTIADSLTGTTAIVPVIAPGETVIVEFDFPVPVTALQGTVFANRVTVNWPENPTTTPETSEAQFVTALPSTLLELTVEATPGTAAPGAVVLKTIRITNVSDRTQTDVSNRTLTNVHVIDTLLQFSTIIASLGPGESRSFTLPFTIPADSIGGQIFRNDVIVFSDQSPLQQASVDIVTESLPNAALTETVDRPVGHPGDIVHFTITLKNTGNLALLNGVLTAPLLNLIVRIEVFDIGAVEIIRVPFKLPEVEEDTVIVSPVTFVSDNGPPRSATASVRVVTEEEE
ncbi:SBBP repeat-containing protein [Paenibacillus sp. NPDC058071]|uniref:DUF7948 domain-containing protein n=1 Tax=Paenibacillus sp. NPDC058071 TaxID=3346326 RepID=UPI0036D7A93B